MSDAKRPQWFPTANELHKRVLKLAHHRTGRTAILPYSFPDFSNLSHGLSGEAGEVAQGYKKYERGDFDANEYRAYMAKELADVRVYTELLAFGLNIDLNAAVEAKLQEVTERWDQIEAEVLRDKRD